MIESAPPVRADNDNIDLQFFRIADDLGVWAADQHIFGCFYFLRDERSMPFGKLIARDLFLRDLYIADIDRGEWLACIRDRFYSMNDVKFRLELVRKFCGILHRKLRSIGEIHGDQY